MYGTLGLRCEWFICLILIANVNNVDSMFVDVLILLSRFGVLYFGHVVICNVVVLSSFLQGEEDEYVLIVRPFFL